MFNFKALWTKKTLWDFPGGIHPAEMKSQTSDVPLRTPPLPPRFIVSLKQHPGKPGEPCVQPGDQVLRGQPLSQGQGRMLPVHAPTSGRVLAIAPWIAAHPSGLSEPCVHIEADGEDRWHPRRPWPDYQSHSRADLLARLHDYGIAGLGGAGFPTAAKLQSGGDRIRTLIINAAECEPYITADDRLMQEHAWQIVQGIQILIHLLEPQQTLIGIEDNKPQAIACLRQALAGQTRITLQIIPTKYPSGGARQLTRILTGKSVPVGARSVDIGVLMQNIGTVYAIKRAIIDGEPLTERVVTLTGNALPAPGNVMARIGTPVRHLLAFAGYTTAPDPAVIMGGPLMGFQLPSLDVPIIKTSNCLIAPANGEIPPPAPEKACIRCSACAEKCPASLLPQQLYLFSKSQQHDKASAYNLDACIECGICAFVCPSNIPLVQYFRRQKAQIRDIADQTRRAAEAKARFQARQTRLEQEKIARQRRHQQAAAQPFEPQPLALQPAAQPVVPQPAIQPLKSKTPVQLSASQTAIPFAPQAPAPLARQTNAPMLKLNALTPHPTPSPQTAPTQPPVDLHKTTTTIDPRKAAVAAALARVKARKAQQATDNQQPAEIPLPTKTQQPTETTLLSDIVTATPILQPQPTPSPQTAPIQPPIDPHNAATTTDPRKAAVAAALARVKARKAQQATDNQQPAETLHPTKTQQPTETTLLSDIITTSPINPHKAATTNDPRKAAVAAALARIKARKAQHATDNQQPAEIPQPTPSPQAPTTEPPIDPHKAATTNDPRKAAVAAALARVKARKAQQTIKNQQPVESLDTIKTQQPTEANSLNDIVTATPILQPQPTPSPQAPTTQPPIDPHKAAATDDPRKAAVAAALARVKARKAQQATDNQQPAETPQPTPSPQAPTTQPPIEPHNAATTDDPRKAAIAAALARVKARKAQQALLSNSPATQLSSPDSDNTIVEKVSFGE